MTTTHKEQPLATRAHTVLLSPVDAWFFRDGRPYNASETNQTDVMSLFPPSATTLVGALRAGLARGRGWNGTGKWSQQLAQTLGDGFADLGRLRFGGPWLVRRLNGGNPEFVFPMPLHVLGKRTNSGNSNEPRWQPACLLTPGIAATSCDLGDDVRLPEMSAVRAAGVDSFGLKEPSSKWVTCPGLERILNGQLPEPSQVIEARALWTHEMRVGLVRNETSRTTQEGALYSPRFVRLTPGVSLAVSVTGLPDESWRFPDLLPLGGEGRLAECQPDDTLAPPRFTASAGKKLTVTLLTPMLPSDDGNGCIETAIPGDGPFMGWPGTRVVSACIGKPLALGGWDSLQREPLPLRPVLPAGSTWFLQIQDPAAILDHAIRGVGIKTQYGFGQVALGVWPQGQGELPT